MQHTLNHGKLFRIGFVAVALVALLSFGLMRFGSIPSAKAFAVPSIVQSVTVQDMVGSDTSIQATLPNNLTNADEVVVLVGWGGGNDWSLSSLSSSDSMSYTPIGGSTSDGLYDRIKVQGGFVGSSQAGNSETVTANFTENGCPCGSTWLQMTMTVVEVSGEDTTNLSRPFSGWENLVENGSGGTSHVTASNGSNGLNTAADDLDLAIYIDGGSNTTISYATGESALGSSNSPTANLQHAQLSAATLSHAEFDTSGSAGYSVVFAVSIPSA